MKTARLLYLLFFACAFNCLLPLSVSGQKIFQKTFRNYADGAYDFIMKNDSEFYFFGFSDPSTNNFDQPLIMKTDADANIIWSYVYGDTAYITHAIDNGDGLVVFGEYTSAVSMFSTDIDYFVMKVDYYGNIIWQKRYGTDGYDFGQITPAADGGYLLTGSSRHIDQLLNIDSTFLTIIKLDSLGNFQWDKFYSIGIDPQIRKTFQLADSTFLMVGYTVDTVNGYGKGLLLKSDFYGNLLWGKEYADSLNDLFFLNAVQANDFSITCCGYFDSNNYIAFLMQLDTSGSILWSKKYGSSNFPQSLFYMNDSSFIMILGFSIMKFNKAGNHLESHTYVPNFPSQAEFFKGVPTSDNGLMLGGINPASGLFIVKTDSLLDGGSCGTFNFSGVSNQVMIPIVEVASWSVVNYSIKTGSTFVQDTIALIKTIWCETATNIDEQKYFQNYKVYPNPVSYELNIEKLTLSKAFSSIMIYNSLGIKISEMRNCSDKFTKIDVSKFPSGLYEILLQVEDSKDHIKFIKINQ